MDVFNGLTRDGLTRLLDRIKNARAAVLGDMCLDVYWLPDMKRSELSRETPHFPLPVIEERMTPGGGGNVAANLAALSPAAVCVVGVSGRDWRGAELLRLLGERGIDTSGMIVMPGIVTNAYCKPLRAGISGVVYEDPRLDFCNYAQLGREAEDSLIASLDAAARDIDVLCVSDQLINGVVTEAVKARITELARAGLRVVVDSRYRIGTYRNVILKPNEIEGACAAGLTELSTVEDFGAAARKLAHISGSEVVMTLGPLGSLYSTGEAEMLIPAHEVKGEIDIVGAGDAFLSGLSLALAAGATRPEAAGFASLCSEVTIRKLKVTGTASAEEILTWFDKQERGQ